VDLQWTTVDVAASCSFRDSTRFGFSNRNRSRLYSVGRSSITAPPRRTSCESSSISRSAYRSFEAPSSREPPVRRRTARMRATTSSRLNGFVT